MADASRQDVPTVPVPTVLIPTVLGSDASFKGEVTFDKSMSVHGRFEGKITTAGTLHVAREAMMEVEVEAGQIVVEGQVHGQLTAGERLELKQSARYEGDVRASRMVVEDGAVFNGHMSVGPDAVKPPALPPHGSRAGEPHPNAAYADRPHAAATPPAGNASPLRGLHGPATPPMPAALTR
ncbi:MAG: polymer-forming cytoskeletal protein [Tepidisphaeraceae bacterium]|jgi:cytoskeletal protein CcmA (bactofilin family)